MLRGRLTPLLVVAITLAPAACGDTPTLPNEPLRGEPDASTGDLTLRLPAGAFAGPVARDVRALTPPRAALDGAAPVAPPVDLTDTPPSSILNARTETGFRPGFAFAFGTHDYSGNIGRIETTARASHRDRFLGSLTAERQDYIPFLTDLGRIKKIWTWAKIFTDETCGVTVGGSSVHSAWWEFFQGRSASSWGRSSISTQGTDSSQPACTGGTGGYEREDLEPGGLICSYWITYDLRSGEILSADFLGCVDSSYPKI